MKKYTQEDINNLIKIRQNKRYLEHLNFYSCDLSGLDLNDIVFLNVNISNSNLSTANLYDADLFRCNLSNTNLYNSNLVNATLSYANLYNSNLSNANLSSVNLSYANLFDTNLTNANLCNVKLHNCIGNGKEIKSMQIYKYNISWTKYRLQIGCKNYSHKEWKKFTDDEISIMGTGALHWWKKHKEEIFNIIEE